jgi:hypothetical protein
MLDAEGKEVLFNEKAPIQYFFNLGLEYYRMMNQATLPPTAPIMMGASGAPMYSTMPLTQPQTPQINYLSSSPYIAPSPMQQQTTPHGSNCVQISPHFHPYVHTYPSSSMPAHPSNNRYYVQVPQTANMVPQPQYTTSTDNKPEGGMEASSTASYRPQPSNPVLVPQVSNELQPCHSAPTYYTYPSSYPAQYYTTGTAPAYSQPPYNANQDVNCNHVPASRP